MNEGQIIPYIVFGVICGFITDKIRKDKGYVKSWFWWGFFFQILAILIALAQKPAAQSAKSKPEEAIEKYIDLVNRAGQPRNSASWNCICGRQNPSYTGTCACGRTKEAVFEEFESRQRFAQSGVIGKIPLEEEESKPVENKSDKPGVSIEILSEERARFVNTMENVLQSREKSKVHSDVPEKPMESADVEETHAWIQPETLPTWTQPEPLPIWSPELFANEMDGKIQVDLKKESNDLIKPIEVNIEEIQPKKTTEKIKTQSILQPDHEEKIERTILTNPEIQSLLSQAAQLSTADEIYSFLRNYRTRVKTQEFNSLIQELQNDAVVERAYGNNKSTAILHIDLYRNNSGMQTTTMSFG